MNPTDALRDGSKELWDSVRARVCARGGLYFFAKAILLYPDLTRRTHLPLCLFLEDEKRKNKLVEYPRRHLKTTIATVSYTLWRFAKAAAEGRDLDERIAIVSSTKVNAMRFLRQIKAQVERNEILTSFFPELVPDMNEDVWNKEEITFPRHRVRDAPSIDTFGAGTKATSRHYDGIIEDDMINEENWDSEDAITKAIDLHRLAENLLEDANKSWRCTTENAWIQYDLNHHIVENEPETAIMSVGASTGVNRHRTRHLPAIVEEMVEAWDDGDTLWPERFDHEALGFIRQKVGNFIYNAQYENNPFDPDVVDFKEEWLGYYEWTTSKHPHTGRPEPAVRFMPRVARDATGEVIHAVPMEVVPLREFYTVAAWDLATDAKTTKDRNALVVTGVDSKERVVVFEAVAKKSDPLDFITEVVFPKVGQWWIMRLAIEVVAFQRFLLSLLPKLLNEWNSAPERKEDPATQISLGIFEECRPGTGRSKEARIRYLVSIPFQNGQVYIHKTHTDFVDEYTHFPKGKTDDLLDAFAYTATLWRPGESDDEVVKREAEEVDHRDPVTGY